MKPLVELHVHLDGCIRLETAYELLVQKNLPCPGDGSLKDFKAAVKLDVFKDLHTFLEKFAIFLPGIIDDLVAIERMAYEFCEDKAKQGVIYVETRYSPHLLLSTGKQRNEEELDKVVEAVNRGLLRGSNDFKINAKSILAYIRGIQGWSTDILRLCKKYRRDGVVGIDIAGTASRSSTDEHSLFDEDIAVFNAAKLEGIRRTVHAGEAGGPNEVQRALDELQAERIGHGYHIVDDPTVYERCLKEQVHLECCPWSSIMTGSVAVRDSSHPIARFAKDGINFSLNTDDPTITETTLEDEYTLVKSWGLTDDDIINANIRAALNCFAEEDEKKELLKQLKDYYTI